MSILEWIFGKEEDWYVPGSARFEGWDHVAFGCLDIGAVSVFSAVRKSDGERVVISIQLARKIGVGYSLRRLTESRNG